MEDAHNIDSRQPVRQHRAPRRAGRGSV